MGRGDSGQGTKVEAPTLDQLTNMMAGSRRHRAEAYYAAGFRPSEVRPWMDASIPPELAIALMRSGKTPAEAKRMLAEMDEKPKLVKAKNLKEWRDAGFEAKDAHLWTSAGFSVKQAKEWKGILRNTSKLELVADKMPEVFDTKEPIASLGRWKRAGVKQPRDLLQELYEHASGHGVSRRVEVDRYVALRQLDVDPSRAFSAATSDESLERTKKLIAEGIEPSHSAFLGAHCSSNTPIEVIIDWAKTNSSLNAGNIDSLHRAGVGVDYYRRWRSELRDVADVISYHEAGFAEPDEARGWLDLDKINEFPRGDSSSGPRRGENNLKDLVELGVTPEEVRKVIDLYENTSGTSLSPRANASRIYRLAAAGVSPAEQLKWEAVPRMRRTNPDSLIELREIEPNVSEANKLLPDSYQPSTYSAHMRIPPELIEDANDFVDHGVSPTQVQALRRIRVANVTETVNKTAAEKIDQKKMGVQMDAWMRLGLGARDAIEWWPVVAKKSTLGEAAPLAKAWQEAGFSPEEAAGWQSGYLSELTDPRRVEVAREFRDQKMTPRQASEWDALGFRAAEAARWRRAGVGRAARANELRRQGVDPNSLTGPESSDEEAPKLSPSKRMLWSGYDFSLSEAAEWVHWGIEDPKVAREWRRAGQSPEQAANYERARSQAKVLGTA